MSADLAVWGTPLAKPEPGSLCEINCTNFAVAELVRDSLSENTRRAYASDLAHFENWGGVIPSSPELMASYLADHASTHSVATLVRRLASISRAHRAQGYASPTGSELVRATLRGIKRRVGCRQKEAKPLLRDDLLAVLDSMGDCLRDARDRALLLIGFAGAFRRSELVGLDLADVEEVRQGLILHVRRSKTDQTGVGRKLAIPLGRRRWCPVEALANWIARAAIQEGALFRSVDRHSNVSKERLSGEAVSLVIQERLSSAGVNSNGYSGHSLRAGLATSAAEMQIPTWKIRQQTGHRNDAMLSRYIRNSDLFRGNAAGVLL